jgi:MFS-type transporter involved in bile tolerance (Atg22 family)
MSHLLNRFSFQAAKWNSWIILVLIFIWVCVLACVIGSILAQPFDRKQRIFWIAIVILLPFLGILSYLPFAFRKEELPLMFMRKSKRHRKRKEADSDSE